PRSIARSRGPNPPSSRSSRSAPAHAATCFHPMGDFRTLAPRVGRGPWAPGAMCFGIVCRPKYSEPRERIMSHLIRTICRYLLCGIAGATLAWPVMAQDVLPRPEPPFKGKIGRTVKTSMPDFPKGVEAPKGAPNVLLILTDDVGFGASSTFGGPIQT